MSKQKSDLALENLRRDILNGSLPPGSPLSEAGVAERYDAGRAGARTALQRLSQQGLVEVRPRRGYVISGVTIGDVREIFQLRLVLEPLAARLAAGRVDAEQMRERELAAKQLRNTTARPNAEVIGHNRFIHMHIAQASGNARLERQIGDLLGESERCIVIGLKGGHSVPKMLDEHIPLIHALAAGDADLAEARARQHIQTTMENVMEALISSRQAVLDQAL